MGSERWRRGTGISDVAHLSFFQGYKDYELNRSYSCSSFLHSSLLSFSISPSFSPSFPSHSQTTFAGSYSGQPVRTLYCTVANMHLPRFGNRQPANPNLWELLGWATLGNIISPNSFCPTTLYCLQYCLQFVHKEPRARDGVGKFKAHLRTYFCCIILLFA